MSETVKERLTKNVFYNTVSTLVSRIGALIFTIIVARSLFPELFGIYSLALTITLTIATFTDLGINSTLIRYLAESLKIKKQKEKEARSRIAFLFNFKIFLTAIIALTLFFLSNIISIYIFKKPSLILPLKIGAIYLFVISLQGFLTSIFYALQKVKYNTIAETLFQVLRIVLVTIFFLFYKASGSKVVGNVFISLSIAIFVSCVFLYFVLIKKYNFLLKGEKQELRIQDKKRLLSFFGWLTISSISLVFFAHIDTFMLGIFLPAEFVGYYQAVFSLVATVAAFVAFSSILLPVFTQLGKKKLEKGFQKIFNYLTIIAIPSAIGLAFVIVPAIQIIYGKAYVPLQYKLAITITSVLLSLLVFESAMAGLYSSLFQAKEKAKIPALILAFVTIANIILNYIFIKIGISIAPQYGLVGVAAATLITRYGNLIALSILAKKKLNIKTNMNSVIKPLVASIIMLVFLFIFDYFITMSIFTGILMIIAAAIIYVIVVFAIKGITQKDFQLIKRL